MTLLAALWVTPLGAGEAFDGRWTVESLVLSGGMCTATHIGELRVRDGRIEVFGHSSYVGPIVASGQVDDSGTAAFDGYIGAHFLLSISGRFGETEASGRIDFRGRREDCTGTWTAKRAGAI